MGGGYQILSQQNGVINPAGENSYNQAFWHRDLPYQHVVFSRPIAVNALYCVDDFTVENGATLVLPASHLAEKFPSEDFVSSECRQVTAPAGSFIVLDCMTYHRGAINRTSLNRRAVNHVFTIPFLRQQIDLPGLLGENFTRDPEERRVLGYEARTPMSDLDYFQQRFDKIKPGGGAI